MGNQIAKAEGSQIGAGKMEADPVGGGVGTGKMEAVPIGAGKMEAAPIGAGKMEAAPIGTGVGSEATQISGTEEKPLEITADQLKALEEAALELAAIKLEEVSDLFTAAGRFAAARQISYLPEPEPLFPKIMGSHEKDKLRAIAAGRIVRAVYRGTLAQRRALERATRKHLQLDTRHVDPVALQVHKELTRTAILGDKVLSPLDVARVLKAEANVSGLHPNDLKTLKRIKVFGENVNTIAGVVVGTGSACGAISSLRHWNTSYPMSDLPEDFFW